MREHIKLETAIEQDNANLISPWPIPGDGLIHRLQRPSVGDCKLYSVVLVYFTGLCRSSR